MSVIHCLIRCWVYAKASSHFVAGSVLFCHRKREKGVGFPIFFEWEKEEKRGTEYFSASVRVFEGRGRRLFCALPSLAWPKLHF